MSQVVCCSHGGGLRVNDSHEMSFFICYFLKKQQKIKFSSTALYGLKQSKELLC